jgi:hypothetical protein
MMPISATGALALSREEVLDKLQSRRVAPVKGGSHYNKEEGIDLLNRVLLMIADEPARFDMEYWIDDDPDKDRPTPACGTVGCLAGWISIVRPPAGMEVMTALSEDGHNDLVYELRHEHPAPVGAEGLVFGHISSRGTDMHSWGDIIIASNARDALGISDDDALYLFNEENWPWGLAEQYAGEDAGSLERVRVLSERLSYWAESGE